MSEISRSRIDAAGTRIRRAMREAATPANDDVAVVAAFRIRHLPLVVELHAAVERLRAAVVRQLGEPTERLHRYEVGSRPKTMEAILAKVGRSTTRLSLMQDVAGARLVVPTLAAQDIALELLLSVMAERCPRVKDTRQRGDDLGYRAVHVVVRWHDLLAEIQIRTANQQLWAQTVERLDGAHGTDLKHGVGPAARLEWLKEISDELCKADLGESYSLRGDPSE